VPTEAPTEQPTEAPTEQPTEQPTVAPDETVAPEIPDETLEPTEEPSAPMAAARLMIMDRSETTFDDPLVATQWAAANSFVYLPQASVASDQPIATGTPFVYRVYYGTLSSPLYDPGDGISLSAYNYYDNVGIQVVAPDNIKLIDNSGNLIANPGDSAVIPISSRLTAGSAGSITFQGVMIDNGQSASGTLYDKQQLSIHAEVSVSGETVNFDQPIASEDNSTTVTIPPTNEWAIEKTAGNATPAITGPAKRRSPRSPIQLKRESASRAPQRQRGRFTTSTARSTSPPTGLRLPTTQPTFTKDGVTILPQSSFDRALDGSGSATTTVSGGEGTRPLAITPTAPPSWIPRTQAWAKRPKRMRTPIFPPGTGSR
jgi:hypothetical protein